MDLFGLTLDFIFGKKIAKTGITPKDINEARKRAFERYQSGKIKLETYKTIIKALNKVNNDKENIKAYESDLKTAAKKAVKDGLKSFSLMRLDAIKYIILFLVGGLLLWKRR